MLFLFKITNNSDFEYKYLIIITLIIIGIISTKSKLEFLPKSTKSDVGDDFDEEALANIVSLYNKENLKVTNLEVTGKFIAPTATIGKLNVTDNITSVKTTTNNLDVSNKLEIAKNANVGGNVNCKENLIPKSSVTIKEVLNTDTIVAPSATIGSWDIREQKFGIPNLGILTWEGGDWLRFLNYDQKRGGSYFRPGFAANAMSSNRNMNDIKGQYVITSQFGRMQHGYW